MTRRKPAPSARRPQKTARQKRLVKTAVITLSFFAVSVVFFVSSWLIR